MRSLPRHVNHKHCCPASSRHPRASVRLTATTKDIDVLAGGIKQKKRLRINFHQPLKAINWPRWELVMLQMIEERETKAQAEGLPKEDQTNEPEASEQTTETASTTSDWDTYFRQYDNPSVHQARLLDDSYLAAWETAISVFGPTHIKGKTVLDVGCGTGLLSLLCAKAGAKKVIAVEGSKTMADVAKQVAANNGYSSVIEVVNAKVEDIQLRTLADVLICDWPGPGLWLGGMAQSMAYARKHLLKPGGLMLPSHASLHVTGIEDRTSLMDMKTKWESVSGCDLTAAMSAVVSTPRVSTITRPSQICTDTVQLQRMDLSQLTVLQSKQGQPPSKFQLTCLRDERLFGLMLNFDLEFKLTAEQAESGEQSQTQEKLGTSFTTSPQASTTQFQQVILNFPRSIKVQKGDVLEGSIACVPCGFQGRDVRFDVQVTYSGVSADASYTLPYSVPFEAVQCVQ